MAFAIVRRVRESYGSCSGLQRSRLRNRRVYHPIPAVGRPGEKHARDSYWSVRVFLQTLARRGPFYPEDLKQPNSSATTRDVTIPLRRMAPGTDAAGDNDPRLDGADAGRVSICAEAHRQITHLRRLKPERLNPSVSWSNGSRRWLQPGVSARFFCSCRPTFVGTTGALNVPVGLLKVSDGQEGFDILLGMLRRSKQCCDASDRMGGRRDR